MNKLLSVRTLLYGRYVLKCVCLIKYQILGASDVFARMFEIKMSECQTGQVVIEDLEPHIVEMMLRFMYSRKAPELRDVETGISLYEAADKVSV